MSKTVVIHQPDFLPYLGFFHRFLQADMWVILDNVQFLSGSKGFHNRDKIKTKQGNKWLTVAVQKCPRGTMINDVLLSEDVKWKEDNLNLIKYNYGKAPFINEIWPYVEELYNFECNKMIDFNLKSIDMLKDLLGIEIETILASTLKAEGNKNDLMVDICKKTGAAIYLSGVGAKDYFEPEPFDKAGLQVMWQDFKHPVYTQLHGEFIPFLSSIDLLFNCGVIASREIVRTKI